MKSLNRLYRQILFLAICLTIQKASQNNVNGDTSIESFIQSELKIKTLSSLKLGNEISVVIQNKKQRSTLTGGKCLKWWKLGLKLINGCTTKADPDGGDSGRDWCRIEKDKDSNKDWAFCAQEMDYDQIRQYTNDNYESEIVAMNKMSYAIQKLQPVCTGIMGKFKDLKKQQDKLQKKISDMKQEYTYMANLFDLLKDLKIQWEKILAQIKVVEQQIKSTKVPDPSKLAFNCEGMQNYEEDASGDGFIANFYNNEFFSGIPLKVPQTTMRYNWQGQQPHPEINAENFSIIFEGLFKVPISQTYKFFLQVDNGVKLEINGQTVIDHYTTHIQKGWKDAQYGEETVSDDIQLNAGQLYKFKIHYWHSQHTFYQDKKQSFLKLQYSSDKFTQQMIPDNKFFTQLRQPLLQVYDYQTSWANLTVLRNFDKAFQDTENHQLQDIPPHYQNQVSLKLNQKYIENEIKFGINQKADVYVGIKENAANPLDTDFEFTEETISVMRVISDKAPANFIAKDSIGYKLYKKKFDKGHVKIPLAKKTGQHDSYIVFISLDTDSHSQQSCGGATQELTHDHDDFKICEESSKDGDGRSCKAGISGIMEDSENNMWVAKNENSGAWVEYRFKSQYQISSIQYKNRDDVKNQASKLSFEFQDKTKQEFSLKKLIKPQSLDVKTVITDTVRIQIDQTFNQGRNVGGSFAIKGVKCNSISAPVVKDFNKVIEFSCGETAEKNQNLRQQQPQSGETYKGRCPSNCKEDWKKVIGYETYPTDSMICASAFHAGATNENGGSFDLIIKNGIKAYEAKKENGIQSNSLNGKPGQYAINFKGFKKDDFRPFVGQLVDVQLDNKWQDGLVKKVEKVSGGNNIYNLNVLINGQSDKTIRWPSQTITFCGKKIPKRKCDKKSEEPSMADAFKANICFGLKQDCGTDYIIDQGHQKKFQNKLNYGWENDMSNMLRCSSEDQAVKSLQCHMLFPPSKREECQKKNSAFVCQSTKWSINVPHGNYKVTILVLDPHNNFINNLQVNSMKFANNLVTKKNFVKIQKEVLVNNGQIEISDDCDQKCDIAWSRISAIEIEQQPLPILPVPQEPTEQSTIGCNTQTKGRCDDTSDDDIYNCYWPDYEKSITQIGKCIGIYHLIQIPTNTKCPSLAKGYKCIKTKYHINQQKQCQNDCPLDCKMSDDYYYCAISGFDPSSE